jgi:hypothetical protein
LEPVSAGPTRPGSVFRTGTRKSGAYGKKRTTRSEPCPVCGQAACSYSDDLSLLTCWRSGGESKSSDWVGVRPGSRGGYLFSRAGSSDEFVRAKIEHLDRERLTGSAVWQARAEKYLADPEADAQRRRLAQELGVDVWSLAALSVGWKPGAYKVGAWSYPQRTAAGEIVSVGLRINRDEDRQRFDSDGGETKSPPGIIFVPGRWLTASGPVVMVEGMSDTAAIDTIRLDVVGHPGHTPPPILLDELEAVLRAVPADREIIRMADREDGWEQGRTPGLTGARKTAQSLATRLGRRIGVALAPDEAKDSRAWVRERWLAGPVSPARRDELRETFVSGILGAVEWFEPQERTGEADVPVEPLQDTGEEVGVDEFRERMRDSVSAWAKDDRVRGRIAVLAAPAGSGKTTAVDDLVLPHYGSFVNAVPVHENCRERLSALQQLPILDPDDVAAFPKLDDSSCISFTDEQAADLRARGHRGAISAQRSQSLGFGVRSTSCRFCPLAPWRTSGQAADIDEDLDQFAPDRVFAVAVEPAVELELDQRVDPFAEIRCGYWREIARANAARGKVATLERIRRAGGTIVDKDDRAILILDESGFETTCPTATISSGLLDLLAEGLEGAALRIEAETAKTETVEPTGGSCRGGEPHKFTTTRVGKNYFDTCAVCGHRVTLKTPAARRRATRPTELGILETDEDRRRRREETREREDRRREREQGAEDRREDQIEHLRQLAAVARELVRRLQERAAAERWGVEVVPIERVVRRRKSGRLSKNEQRKVDAAIVEIVEGVGEPGGSDRGSSPKRSADEPRKLPQNEEVSARVPLVVRGRIVKQSARLLADALERSLPPTAVVNGQALELVRRIHAGKVDCLALHVDPLDGDDSKRTAEGARRVKLSAVATWETRLPDKADVLVLDGTLDVAALSKRLGREIEEISPRVRIRRQSPAVQLPADITRRTSPRTVARTLEQAVASLPGSQRIGVILLQEHRKKLFPRDANGNEIRTRNSRKLVPDHVYRRLARDAEGRILVEHYRGGKDRSSNQWIEHCDGLVLLGTPRPAVDAVVGELVRRLDVAALEQGSPWGRRDWEGRTLDGGLVRIKARGYLDPAWAAAAAAVTRTILRQALERARTILAGSGKPGSRPGGIPVVVVTSEGGLGLPIVEALPDAVSQGARRVEEVVRKLVEGVAGLVGAVAQAACDNPGSLGDPGSDPEGDPTCAKSPTRDLLSLVGNMAQVDLEPIRDVPTTSAGGGDALGAPSRAVFEELVRTGLDGKGSSERHVRRWIAEAVEAGLVTKSGSTRATVYGLPSPIDIPDGDEVEETSIVGPAVVPIPDPDPDPVPDWELDELDFTLPRRIPVPLFPGTGPPPWSSTWSPTGPIEHVEQWQLLPTGPAAA